MGRSTSDGLCVSIAVFSARGRGWEICRAGFQALACLPPRVLESSSGLSVEVLCPRTEMLFSPSCLTRPHPHPRIPPFPPSLHTANTTFPDSRRWSSLHVSCHDKQARPRSRLPIALALRRRREASANSIGRLSRHFLPYGSLRISPVARRSGLRLQAPALVLACLPVFGPRRCMIGGL